MNPKSNSSLLYLGNTRTISNETLNDYCSKFGLVLDCKRCLPSSSEQAHLVDFTFVHFLNSQSVSKFLSTSIHTLSSGITLDVRPYDDILHAAVPLHVDRKICIENVSSQISSSDIKKYLRTFGTIKSTQSEVNDDEQKMIYIEFESAATRNKLLKGKISHHRIKGQLLHIRPFLRPTDVDLSQLNDKDKNSISSSSNSMTDENLLIHLEREYNLKIRQGFDLIENQLTDYLKQKRQNYEYIQEIFK